MNKDELINRITELIDIPCSTEKESIEVLIQRSSELKALFLEAEEIIEQNNDEGLFKKFQAPSFKIRAWVKLLRITGMIEYIDKIYVPHLNYTGSFKKKTFKWKN